MESIEVVINKGDQILVTKRGWYTYVGVHDMHVDKGARDNRILLTILRNTTGSMFQRRKCEVGIPHAACQCIESWVSHGQPYGAIK